MKKRTIPGLRWYVAAMLCMAAGLNYLDRQTLSVLAQTIQDELNLSTVEYSYITSAFLLSYTIMYVVSGRIIDRLGTRRSFMVFVAGWSVSSMLHAFARTAAQFSIYRFALGATESGNFPAGVKAVAEWFPMRERALAIGIFNSGSAVGAALAAPVISFAALAWGWRSAFVVGGALGLVWVVAWALIYRLPREHPRLDPEELKLIESGNTETEIESQQMAAKVSLRTLLKLKPVWGCVVARMLTDPISYFFIFWTPKFLQQERGFDLAAIGRYSWIPFVAAALGNLAGGAVPQWLTSRGWSLDRARKSVMLIASLTMPVCCLVIIQSPSAMLAVAMISVAMFAHAAWANMTLPVEVFPNHVIGSVTGLAGSVGGLTGMVSQLAIGWAVQNLSFTPVFAVSAFVHLAALGVVMLLIGKLGVIKHVPAT